MTVNPVRRAVKFVGSPSKLAAAANVSTTTVYNWLRNGTIDRVRHALRVSDATGGKVTVRQLAEPTKRRNG